MTQSQMSDSFQIVAVKLYGGRKRATAQRTIRIPKRARNRPHQVAIGTLGDGAEEGFIAE